MDQSPGSVALNHLTAQTICLRVPVSSVAGGNLHVLQNSSGWISKCRLRYLECHPHVTACFLQSGMSPMAFAAFTLGAHIATAVRGDRARGQVKLPLNKFLDTAKLF